MESENIWLETQDIWIAVLYFEVLNLNDLISKCEMVGVEKKRGV